jgi:hypothetical protein
MAVGSPMPEPSWSPAGGPAEATPAQPDQHGLAPGASTERALDLTLVRAAIRDGLLMVFGPEGDPVPPQTFGAAATERPDAEVRLMDGPRVRAERVAAVLDAQMSGRLGSGLGGDEPWIRAMLGLGPQPEMPGADDLSAEACMLDVVVFGRELMITSRDGATFLVADARARTPESICVWVGSEGPIAPGALADRVLGGAGEDSIERNPAEITMPQCKAWLEDDALLLDLPGIGPVYLAHISDAGATAPAASLFTASGEVATISDLLNALSRPVPLAAATEQAATPPTATERLDHLPPLQAPCAVDAPSARAVPLTISLPDALAAAPERVVLVVMRGLPDGASLSAGVASGDGSWLLSPEDLPGLSLTPPPDWASDLSVEIAAIGIASAEGELTAAASTVVVPRRSTTVQPAPSSIGDFAPHSMVEPAPSASAGSASSPPGEPAPSASAGFASSPSVEPAPSASTGSAYSPSVEPAPSARVGAAFSRSVEPAPSAPVSEAFSPWETPARASLPLDLDEQFLSAGGPFDAFLVRDLPAGVSLSAGTYEPAMGVWVLLPHQLSGLSVLTSGGWHDDFSLSLMGVSLGAGPGARPRLLARVPVSIGP